MPLTLDKEEHSRDAENWFTAGLLRQFDDSGEDDWNSRHAALFVADWVGKERFDGAISIRCDWELKAEKAVTVGSLALRLQTEQLRVEFEALSKQWRRDTRHISLISKKIIHPAYLRIVGMGEAAVPLLLEALRDHPAHWFAALRATANVEPCSPDANPSQAREAWLNWGKSEGYIE